MVTMINKAVVRIGKLLRLDVKHSQHTQKRANC